MYYKVYVGLDWWLGQPGLHETLPRNRAGDERSGEIKKERDGVREEGGRGAPDEVQVNHLMACRRWHMTGL